MGVYRLGSPSVKRDVIVLGVLFFTALAIRLYFLQFYRVISADGVGYAQIARDFISGKGLGGAAHFPPIYPILVGLMNLVVPDVELAGRLVSILMGSLMVIPIYLLSIELFNKKIGVITAVLSIVWPSIRSWSCEVMSQSTYMTVTLTGIYLTWCAFKKRSLILSMAAGLFMGLSYLTRPEGFIVFFVITAVLVIYSLVEKVKWKEVSLLVIAGWMAFMVISFPYLYLLHNETGKWQLSGKTGATLADALGGYLGRADIKREPAFQGIGYMDVIRKYPDFIKTNFAMNLQKTYEEMVPIYIWLFSIVGFAAGGWSRERLFQRMLLLSTFSPLLIIITFFFVGPEYFQPYLPILFLWAGCGLVYIEGLSIGRIKNAGFKRLTEVFPVSYLLVSALSVFILIQQIPSDYGKPYHFSQDGGRYDHKRIGLLLNKYLPQDAKIMTRWGRIGFYADREWIDMPQASFADIIAIAKTNGARYIVVDGMLMGLRPQLGILFQPLFSGDMRVLYVEKGEGSMPIQNLKLYLLYKDPSSVGMAVYEIIG